MTTDLTDKTVWDLRCRKCRGGSYLRITDSEGLWSGTQTIFSALSLCSVTSTSHDCRIAPIEVGLHYLLGLIGKRLSQLVVLL